MSRTTLAREVSCTGVGIHTGAEVSLVLRPRTAPLGLRFVRCDLPGEPEIRVARDTLHATQRSTTLSRGDASVATVEHLLAALYSFGIDDADLVVDGPEVPVLDGSATAFVEALRAAGRVETAGERSALRVVAQVEVRDGDRWARAEPCDAFAIDYEIDFAHPLIGVQRFACEALDADVFAREIAPARTFGFVSELASLEREQLARGGSLDNALLLDAQALVNPCELHWPDEFVRHKVIDLIGDLALAGAPLAARIRVHKGGHALHQRLLAKLFETPGALSRGSTPAADRS